MGFSRQDYWSGLPCPPPENLPDPEIESISPSSPALQADSSPDEPSVWIRGIEMFINSESPPSTELWDLLRRCLAY